jgi:hypothetical protein
MHSRFCNFFFLIQNQILEPLIKHFFKSQTNNKIHTLADDP